MTTYYHVTHRMVEPLIRREGLLIRCALGKRRAIWLASWPRLAWACLHVIKRHGANVEDLRVFRIDGGRVKATTHRSGLYYVEHDIPEGDLTFVPRVSGLLSDPE